MDRPLDVLLAFDREDARFVSRVEGGLRKRDLSTWSHHLDAGPLDRSSEERLRSSTGCVVFFGPGNEKLSLGQAEGPISARAVTGSPFPLVAVMLPGVPPDADAALPTFFQGQPPIDMRTGPDNATAIEALVASLTAPLLSVGESPAQQATVQQRAPVQQQPPVHEPPPIEPLSDMRLTPSVRDAATAASGAVAAADLVNELLRIHPEYAGGRAETIKLSPGPNEERRPSVEWLAEARALLDQEVVPELHGRAVIVALALTSDSIRDSFEGSGFLPALLDEIREAPDEFLTPRGMERLAAPPPGIYAGYVPDDTAGPDRLGISYEVNALCSLLAYRRLELPISVGLFGDWGSGKSFFMRKMRDRIRELEKASRASTDPSEYCGHICQITFNAWHYADANLWASLVTRIFDRLSGRAADVEAEPGHEAQRMDEEREELFSRLEVTRLEIEEARARQAQADAAAETAKRDLDRIQEDIEAHEEQRKEIRVVDVMAAVKRDDGVNAAAAQLKQDLGTKADLDLDEVIAAGDQLRGWYSRVRRLWRLLAPGKRRLRTAAVIVAVIAAVGLPVVLAFVVPTVAKPVVAVAGFLTPILAVWATIGREVDRWLGRAEEVAATADEARRKELETRQAEEAKVEARLSQLRAEQTAAAQGVADAARRSAEIESEIADIRAGRRLASFIQERSASADYRQHLGIIALIRNDFERLGELLKLASEEGVRRVAERSADAGEDAGLQARPVPERVILYIDDLDRCPTDRVVEVLQAVHLLLAMPLFVVVVGVDPRWLLRSLERHYEDVLARPDQEGAKEDTHWASTPQNYLEKIFQIPYTLPMMERPGYRRLVHSLVHPTVVGDGSGGEAPTPPGRGAPPAGSGPDASEAARGPEEPRSGDVDISGAARESGGAAVPPAPPPTIEVAPRALELTSAEGEFLKALAAMIDTPREVKRLVNTYRLLRAALPERRLDRFLADDPAGAQYAAVITLLGILTGFPDLATEVLPALLDAPNGPWSGFVAGLEPPAEPIEDGARDEKAFEDRSRLVRSLRSLPLPRTAETATFRVWVDEVAKFSFEPGRAVLAAKERQAQRTAPKESLPGTGRRRARRGDAASRA